MCDFRFVFISLHECSQRIVMRRIVLCLVMMAVCAGAAAQRRLTPAEYVEKYKHLAIADQEYYGIPASVKMAQALLESDCGNSRLALQGNNHFGIKCKRDWTGETILHDDDELQECFRKYPSIEESFRDHSEFIDKSARYQPLFELDPTDYKGWARGLKECGYATNPRYAEQLIELIERHELFRLDAEEPGREVSVLESLRNIEPHVDVFGVDVDNYMVSTKRLGDYQVFFNNGSEFVFAQQGETYETISTIVGKSAKKLRRYNDAGAGYQPRAGEQVYIHPKTARSKNGELLHQGQKGETLRFVSQKYGVKLRRLARLNRMEADAVLREGQQIRLR